jgi:hypothetical protein
LDKIIKDTFHDLLEKLSKTLSSKDKNSLKNQKMAVSKFKLITVKNHIKSSKSFVRFKKHKQKSAAL